MIKIQQCGPVTVYGPVTNITCAFKEFAVAVSEAGDALITFSLNERNRRKERLLKWLGYEVNKPSGWYEHPTLILPRVTVERLMQTTTRAWLLWYVLTAKEGVRYGCR